MKDVNIYIYTEYSGSLKSGLGKYHVILETTIEDGNGNIIPYTNEDKEHPEPVMGMVKSITKNRLDLIALKEALSHMTKPSRITIHMASEYITNAFMNDWPEVWANHGYKRKGKPIKHADLWENIMELSKEHDITFLSEKSTTYTKIQTMALKKIKEEKNEGGGTDE